MRKRSTIGFLLFLVAAVSFAINCSGSKKTEEQSHNKSVETDTAQHLSAAAGDENNGAQFKTDPAFQKQLASVFSSYVRLKDAFVASDADKVKSETTETATALSKVDMKLLEGAAHRDWMTYLSPMQASLKEILAASNIEAQRKSFSTLSDNLYKSIKAFGLDGKEAFYDFCPMAFNNQGGYWLSDQEQIRNPYFGDKMLTCGNVQEKLK